LYKALAYPYPGEIAANVSRCQSHIAYRSWALNKSLMLAHMLQSIMIIDSGIYAQYNTFMYHTACNTPVTLITVKCV